MANETIHVAEDVLEQYVIAAFRRVGTSEPSLQAATRAMMHASRVGVDSHGVRLTQHYCQMLKGGRLNKKPQLTIEQKGPSSATVDGDDGLGHYAAYRAMELACDLARETGMAGVGVRRSSHLGAAGAYALAGAEQGFMSFATTNTDSMVPLFGEPRPSMVQTRWPLLHRSRTEAMAFGHGNIIYSNEPGSSLSLARQGASWRRRRRQVRRADDQCA